MDSIRLQFESSLENITEINESFALASLRVCYTGDNINKSNISKAAIERAVPTMYNCPVVCNYDVESDSVGGHDMELVHTDEGKLRLINNTDAIGVVPATARYWWEDVTEDSGITHTYFCTEVILWKRSPAFKYIADHGIVAQSMEINVKSSKFSDEGVLMIDEFVFTAFCLLGEGHKPCFESASVQLYERADVAQQFSQLMQEFKETFAMLQSSLEVVIEKQNLMEGGNQAMEDKLSLAAEFGIDVETLDFSLEDFTVDELREKFEAMKPADPTPVEDPEPTANFELELEFRTELVTALESHETVETCFGQMPRYFFWDYDKELSEVYATDSEDWNIYGFAYSMDGDNVVIDFSSKKRMKIALEPFDEGEQSAPFAGVFATAQEKFTQNDSDWSAKYQEATGSLSALEAEVGGLREFKASTEAEQMRVARENVFAQFEELNGVEAFEALRDNCDGLSLDDLEEKCYAIKGRVGATAKFSTNTPAPKLKVGEGKKNDLPYNGIFERFGIELPEN